MIGCFTRPGQASLLSWNEVLPRPQIMKGESAAAGVHIATIPVPVTKGHLPL